jgi:hypothetical protein
MCKQADNMELYRRFLMLTHASHGTGASVICGKSPDSQTKAKQKLIPKNSPLGKSLRGSNCLPKARPHCHFLIIINMEIELFKIINISFDIKLNKSVFL